MRREYARFVRAEVCRDAHGREASVMRRALRGRARGRTTRMRPGLRYRA